MAYKSKRSQNRQVELALLAQLEGLPSLKPHQPKPWDLHGPQQFLREGYRVQYLPIELMPLFAEHVYTPFDRLKFVNWGKPAVRLAFYDKHKYWLTKDDQLSNLSKTAYIQDYLIYLATKQDNLLIRLYALPPGHPANTLQQQLLGVILQNRTQFLTCNSLVDFG